MKKLLLSALLLGSAATMSYAQPNSVLVYGELGIGSSKNNTDDKSFMFNFNPGVGYQFNRNWTLGLAGGFETYRDRASTATDWNFQNFYRAGVFVRHTMPINKIFFYFTHLESGYLGSAQGITSSNTTTNGNGFYARLTPSVGVMVSHGFALNFGFGGVGYTTYKLVGDTKSHSSFDLTWGTQFNLMVTKNIFCGRKYAKHRRGPVMNHGSKVERDDDDNENDD
jgi:hypothetical protein